MGRAGALRIGSGIKRPVIQVHGTEGVRHTGLLMAAPAGGFVVRGRSSRPTGSGVPTAVPLTTPSPIGEVLPVVGVIPSASAPIRLMK